MRLMPGFGLMKLSRLSGRPVTFGNIPEDVWDGLERMGIDTVWFIGCLGAQSPGQDNRPYRRPAPSWPISARALPDFSPEDFAGSPYCIHRYVVDQHLGGPDGLGGSAPPPAQTRHPHDPRLRPPIMSPPDHPWTVEHPEFFSFRGGPRDLRHHSDAFLAVEKGIFARGRGSTFSGLAGRSAAQRLPPRNCAGPWRRTLHVTRRPNATACVAIWPCSVMTRDGL